jgi:hypothetical protein
MWCVALQLTALLTERERRERSDTSRAEQQFRAETERLRLEKELSLQASEQRKKQLEEALDQQIAEMKRLREAMAIRDRENQELVNKLNEAQKPQPQASSKTCVIL